MKKTCEELLGNCVLNREAYEELPDVNCLLNQEGDSHTQCECSTFDGAILFFRL